MFTLELLPNFSVKIGKTDKYMQCKLLFQYTVTELQCFHSGWATYFHSESVTDSLYLFQIKSRNDAVCRIDSCWRICRTARVCIALIRGATVSRRWCWLQFGRGALIKRRRLKIIVTVEREALKVGWAGESGCHLCNGRWRLPQTLNVWSGVGWVELPAHTH